MYQFDASTSKLPQGEAILEFLKLPRNVVLRIGDYISHSDLLEWKHKFRRNTIIADCIVDVVDFVTASENIDLANLIETLIPCTTPKTFVLNKQYKVVEAPQTTNGKWPDPFGNGFFIDSNYLLTDLIDMVKEKVFAHLRDHHSSQSFFESTQELADLLKSTVDPTSINSYALLILGKIRDRDNKYVFELRDNGGEHPSLYGLHSICTSFLHHFHDMDLMLSAPMIDILKLSQYMNFQLGTILFTVIFFMFVVDMIVIYSMMLTDVQERTYEFAMLRTLGFKNSSLIVLLLVQALFFSLPATGVGFVLLHLFTTLARIVLHT